MPRERIYRLVIACPDRVGLVARVSGFIAERGGWITESDYHSDPVSGWFFMRNEIRAESMGMSVEEFSEAFNQIAEECSMRWRLTDSAVPKRVALLCSKESHCLADLLHRWHDGELDCEICAVISNHDKLASIARWYDIPFHHIPIRTDQREADFAELFSVLDRYQTELVVLARFMQVIPGDYCERYRGRMINIHHSFLPSFAGARPYQQAYERGVKLIGATCHYVTEKLDDGPIIEQGVERVDHRDSIADLKRIGRDIEKTVLARGVRYHLEDRAIIHQNKTVVFS